MENIDVSWMDETIDKYPGKKWFYKLICFFLLKKKLTYSNLYVLSYALSKNKYKNDEIKLKEKIIKDLAFIYYYNNNKLPKGFEKNGKK
jgi:hypothetical protein